MSQPNNSRSESHNNNTPTNVTCDNNYRQNNSSSTMESFDMLEIQHPSLLECLKYRYNSMGVVVHNRYGMHHQQQQNQSQNQNQMILRGGEQGTNELLPTNSNNDTDKTQEREEEHREDPWDAIASILNSATFVMLHEFEEPIQHDHRNLQGNNQSHHHYNPRLNNDHNETAWSLPQ